MKCNLLLTPGPTQLLPAAQEALAKPIIHHRTPQFQENLKDAVEGLKYVFQTKNDIYLIAGSGTAGMEASVANLLSPGDKAITVEGGKFGERWTEICRAYRAEPEVIEVEWGKAVSAETIKELLAKDKNIKAVFTTLCETSTGVTSDIKAIAEAVGKTDAVLVVDAVSGLGVTDLQTDNWGVDVVVSASHKGFMLPPGLAFVSVNEKAMKMMEASQSPRYYLDLTKSKKAWEKNDTPYTPAISLVVALLESIKYFKENGLQNRFDYYTKLAQATRQAAQALGLTLLAEESCISNVLTAINLPESIDGVKLVKTIRDEYGISMAGGQAQLKGRIVRIAHMGCLTEQDILTGIAHLEKALTEMGYKCSPSAGQEAAQKILNVITHNSTNKKTL